MAFRRTGLRGGGAALSACASSAAVRVQLRLSVTSVYRRLDGESSATLMALTDGLAS